MASTTFTEDLDDLKALVEQCESRTHGSGARQPGDEACRQLSPS
jgi:hypothetical protein